MNRRRRIVNLSSAIAYILQTNQIQTGHYEKLECKTASIKKFAIALMGCRTFYGCRTNQPDGVDLVFPVPGVERRDFLSSFPLRLVSM